MITVLVGEGFQVWFKAKDFEASCWLNMSCCFNRWIMRLWSHRFLDFLNWSLYFGISLALYLNLIVDAQFLSIKFLLLDFFVNFHVYKVTALVNNLLMNLILLINQLLHLIPALFHVLRSIPNCIELLFFIN